MPLVNRSGYNAKFPADDLLGGVCHSDTIYTIEKQDKFSLHFQFNGLVVFLGSAFYDAISMIRSVCYVVHTCQLSLIIDKEKK